jgi:hypothetical protein
MSKKAGAIPFSAFFQGIKDELKEGNIEFTQIMEEALSKDSTLALKAKFGQRIELRPVPQLEKEKKDKK